MADVQGITAVLLKYRVPGDGHPRIRAVSRLAGGIGRCAEDGGVGPLSRCGMAYRSAQDWSTWVFGWRAPGDSDEHTFRTSLVPACRCSRQRKLSAGLCCGYLSWPSIACRQQHCIESGYSYVKPAVEHDDVVLQNEDDHVDRVEDSLSYYVCTEEGWGSRGDAFVCPGRACLWAAAHEVTGDGMAQAAGDVAGNDRDDFRADARG